MVKFRSQTLEFNQIDIQFTPNRTSAALLFALLFHNNVYYCTTDRGPDSLLYQSHRNIPPLTIDVIQPTIIRNMCNLLCTY